MQSMLLSLVSYHEDFHSFLHTLYWGLWINSCFKLIKETTSVCLQISLSVELPSVPSDIITFSLFTTSLPKVESHLFTPFMSLCIYLGRGFSATPKRKRTLSLLLIVYLWKNYMEEENECSKMHGRQEVSQSIVIVILY